MKDFRHVAPWLRWWGRLQIARESRALTLLEGLPCAPRLVARIDADALVMTAVPGCPFEDAPPRGDVAEAPRRLAEALRAVHARGLVHLDLRSRENVRIDDDGRVYLIDWASALHLPPGSLRNRVFFRALARVDASARVKWTSIVAPSQLSDKDRAFARRFAGLRRLWPVNWKGAFRPGGMARGQDPRRKRRGRRPDAEPDAEIRRTDTARQRM